MGDFMQRQHITGTDLRAGRAPSDVERVDNENRVG
ncbi:hypothetical protein PSYPI_14883 [Pseudomonas syringae pv. pisi str. 1704B]|uniref:Uncharacterized protein n=1 Tax=Pseudomonas syringae pv. pisi str. 1704B TaxID=629263 RepID=F3G943_PSESJ|nr:hypothetical protein PSYPI_14883 [Pseudomonas syringae pv. pisi str. 1704B]